MAAPPPLPEREPELVPETTRIVAAPEPLSEPVPAEAISQTVRLASVAPKPLPVGSEEPERESPPSTVPATPERPPKRFGLSTIVMVVVVLANAGLGAGLASLRRDEQRAREPVAKMSADVKTLQASQTDTDARIEETRVRLDEHEKTLTQTIERLDATVQRQAQAERAAKEHAEREAKEIAALNARVGNTERKVDFEVRRVEDALKIIELAQPRPAESTAPPPKPKAPAHGHRAEHAHH